MKANLGERRKLLLTVLDAVYVDAWEARVWVSIRPKGAIRAVLGESLPSHPVVEGVQRNVRVPSLPLLD